MICGAHEETDLSQFRFMHEKIAGSKLVVVPHAGHVAFVDQPDFYMKAVNDFLHKK